MTIKFNMENRGLQSAIKKMSKRLDAIQNKRPMYKAASVVMLNWIDKNFKAEGKNHENSSLHWKKLSRITVKKRRKNTTTILQDTGRLKQGWDIFSSNNKATVRSKVNYSEIHEKGGASIIEGVTVTVPQRKILPTQQQGLKIVMPAIQHYIKKNVIR